MLGFQNREQATMNASREAVFAVVSDLSRHAELAGSGEVKSLRLVSDGPLGVGAKFEADEEIRVMGRTTKMTAKSEIVEYDPPTLVSWTSMPSVPPKPRRIQWWFRLTPDGNGTRVVHECEVDFGAVANVVFKGPYALMRGGAVKRGMQQTLENLRARLADD
jgi:uncharacterized protein YndB with AHSA1/START domain